MRQSTKQALSETFKTLLEVRTIDKITVKDIVSKCGVNRQTFYYHFRDIYELMEWTLENDIREYYINSFIPEKNRFFMHMTRLTKHIMRIFC